MDSAIAYLPLLLSLAAVDMLAAISPGPNFVVVTQSAIRGTSRYAAAVVSGIVAANAIWCAAVAFGLSALFDLAPRLYGAVKLVGGAYLIYLGVSLWRSTGRPRTEAEPSFRGSRRAAFLRGLLTNLSNPKSAVYFGSVFAVFMAPGTPPWVQAAAIGIVLANTVLWYGTVAALFSRGAVQRLYAAVERPINRAAGTVMVAFGGRLVLDRD